MVNDNELKTDSVIPESGDKCGRHYFFTDEECLVVSYHSIACNFKFTCTEILI